MLGIFPHFCFCLRKWRKQPNMRNIRCSPQNPVFCARSPCPLDFEHDPPRNSTATPRNSPHPPTTPRNPAQLRRNVHATLPHPHPHPSATSPPPQLPASPRNLIWVCFCPPPPHFSYICVQRHFCGDFVFWGMASLFGGSDDFTSSRRSFAFLRICTMSVFSGASEQLARTWRKLARS